MELMKFFPLKCMKNEKTPPPVSMQPLRGGTLGIVNFVRIRFPPCKPTGMKIAGKNYTTADVRHQNDRYKDEGDIG
jgi:hypothetical protein